MKIAVTLFVMLLDDVFPPILANGRYFRAYHER